MTSSSCLLKDEAPVLKDEDIREPLFAFLEENYGKCRIFEEKVIGRARADVVMVLPDALVGLEIAVYPVFRLQYCCRGNQTRLAHRRACSKNMGNYYCRA